MALEQKLKLKLIFFIFVAIPNINGLATSETGDNSKSVKKAQPPNGNASSIQPTPVEIHFKDSAPINVVEIVEKPQNKESEASVLPVTSNVFTNSQIHVEETNFKKKTLDDGEIPDSFQTGFYFFLALSSTAVIFIVVKVYRLRLSRAERKYGVQGDRTTQELTPLPISIEDANSDDDDQTLFELNRQQIRIL